jgi:EAL domain-containing protein (putative c-di-GMP-specific phosphodiesterase class I)
MSGKRFPPLTLPVLQRAADAGHLFLAYQPKLDLRSGEISSVEALARWHHPTLGHIEPSAFIPETENAGLIDWFTEWAIRTAIQQWSQWHSANISLAIAVNISALNLRHVGFPDLVSQLCKNDGLDTRYLTLELTEGATQEATRLMDTTARFRLKGIGLSLDDFGTGYGSLVQLRQLPFTELKIDRAFVLDLLTSQDSRVITRGLIQIAHGMGLTVTAEGVEDLATLDALVALGCDKAQGFVIAMPMPGDRLVLWLSKWTSSSVGLCASLPAPEEIAHTSKLNRRSPGN